MSSLLGVTIRIREEFSKYVEIGECPREKGDKMKPAAGDHIQFSGPYCHGIRKGIQQRDASSPRQVDAIAQAQQQDPSVARNATVP